MPICPKCNIEFGSDEGGPCPLCGTPAPQYAPAELQGSVVECPECNYNLAGLPDGKCPECGTPFEAEEVRTRVDRKMKAFVSKVDTAFESIATLLIWMVVLTCVVVPPSGFRAVIACVALAPFITVIERLNAKQSPPLRTPGRNITFLFHVWLWLSLFLGKSVGSLAVVTMYALVLSFAVTPRTFRNPAVAFVATLPMVILAVRVYVAAERNRVLGFLATEFSWWEDGGRAVMVKSAPELLFTACGCSVGITALAWMISRGLPKSGEVSAENETK